MAGNLRNETVEELPGGIIERRFCGDVLGEIDRNIRLPIHAKQLPIGRTENFHFDSGAAGDEIAFSSGKFTERLTANCNAWFPIITFWIEHFKA